MNYKRRISKGFWVWGQFDSVTSADIIKQQQEINNTLKGPKFDLHLTLSGPLLDPDDIHKKRLSELSNLFAPVKINLDGVGMTDEFFQSLFLNIKENSNLLDLKTKIDDVFQLDNKSYFPHISLYYGNAKKDLKTESVRNIKKTNEVILDKISLVSVDETIQSWKVIESFSLFESNQ